MSIFDNGQCEGVKLTVHAALGAIALVCLGYNAISFVRRFEKHLALNVVMYGALVWMERRKVSHHWRDC